MNRKGHVEQTRHPEFLQHRSPAEIPQRGSGRPDHVVNAHHVLQARPGLPFPVRFSVSTVGQHQALAFGAVLCWSWIETSAQPATPIWRQQLTARELGAESKAEAPVLKQVSIEKEVPMGVSVQASEAEAVALRVSPPW